MYKKIVMTLSVGEPTVTLDSILDYKTELEILNYYLDVGSLPITILSPLRDDRSPSFRIDYNENGNIRYYDFGSKDKGGIFDLIMNIFNLSFSESLQKIYSDMIIGQGLNKIERKVSIKSENHSRVINKLKVKVRPFRAHDLEFWGNGGITEEWLKFGDIYAISHLFIVKDDNEMIIPCERYAYAYIEFKDGLPTYKIYQPFSEKYKWTNQHDKSVWDLWTKLPETGGILIITSSRKDALTIWANTGIPATSLQAESLSFKNNVLDDIKTRFKQVYVLYDNDFNREKNYGRNYGKELCSNYGLIQIEIPDEYKCKDPFELRSKYDKDKFSQIINELIK